MRRAVFLDRDGVLNHALLRQGRPAAPWSLSEFRLVKEAAPALSRLRRAGFLLVVVTNQPDIAYGRLTLETLAAMHARLRRALPVNEILVCPHRDEDRCLCRKPRPGMLQQAARSHQIDLALSYMIGDRWRDIDAGHHAGCVPLLIGDGYGERAPEKPPAAVLPTLTAAVDWILSRPDMLK